jgi:acetyl esterase/lipase
MSSRHLVDPELHPLLDIPSMGFNHEMLPMLRAGMAGAVRAIDPLDDQTDIEVLERKVPGPAGAPEVEVLVFRPQAAAPPRPALLYIHGGGYVIGSAWMFAGHCQKFARELDCVVVSVDYRLAPETPHPGPVEDCHAALQWLRGQAAELGVDPGRVAVMGESAGGGLAAALALLARDRGEVPFILQVLVAPMIDDRTAVRADVGPYTGEFIWTREHNLFGWTCLLGGPPGGPDVSPYAAAARAEDLAGLPPTFINLGDLDLFVEEAMDYSRRLLRAGVPVELHVYPGLTHGGGMMAQSRLAEVSTRDVVDALRRAFARSGQDFSSAPGLDLAVAPAAD